MLAYIYKLKYLRSLFLATAAVLRPFRTSAQRRLTRVAGLFHGNASGFELLYNQHSWFPCSTVHNGRRVFLYDAREAMDSYAGLFDDEIPSAWEERIVFDYFRKILLSDYLRKTDMMSMYAGVEWRVPMLDEDLAAFAFSVPFGLQSNLRESKRILRALHGKVFPQKTSSAPKTGFEIPLDRYLTAEEKREIGSIILRKGGLVLEWVDGDYVRFLLQEFCKYDSKHLISRAAVYQRILMLYALQRWSEKQ